PAGDGQREARDLAVFETCFEMKPLFEQGAQHWAANSFGRSVGGTFGIDQVTVGEDPRRCSLDPVGKAYAARLLVGHEEENLKGQAYWEGSRGGRLGAGIFGLKSALGLGAATRLTYRLVRAGADGGYFEFLTVRRLGAYGRCAGHRDPHWSGQ